MASVEQLQLRVKGAVQGVGFRPFIYRIARNLGLTGYVNNTPQGVYIEVEGSRPALESFLNTVQNEKPPAAWIMQIDSAFGDAIGYREFEIRRSEHGGSKTALVLPDLAVCPDCLADIQDPLNRRYRYPFTNCTNCGPRYTIIQALPYDRPNTTMRGFEMCAACRAEYENPADRRFHAQPNACPHCGPHLELWTPEGETLFTHNDALYAAAEAIRAGEIVAMKGLGGFHLVVDARNDDAVQRLRARKHRPDKPFALMMPSLAMTRMYCEVSEVEAGLLTSPQAPIVLLHCGDTAWRVPTAVADSVAPGNPYLGVMLPYTPLHHLLMGELGFPIVATSGNLSDEPICFDEREALARLHGIADLFLVHNRPIVRPVDDSIVRVVAGREMLIRRARGYAPLPIEFSPGGGSMAHRAPTDNTDGAVLPGILAVGAHQKNTIAVSIGQNIFGSQHIGDLSTQPTFEAFHHTMNSFKRLYEPECQAVACDLHPDYVSTQYAESAGLPIVRVQHHEAHVLSAMLDHQLEPPVLGISWDGTGYGLDGTIWGGECLLIHETHTRRAAYLRPFPLPGGEAAVKEPRRSALGLLYMIWGDNIFHPGGACLCHNGAPTRETFHPLAAFAPSQQRIIQFMLQKGINTPYTSSVGRLFDAVASLLGLCQQTTFEGHAAMLVEFACQQDNGVGASWQDTPTNDVYDFTLAPDGVIDWSPMIVAMCDDVQNSVPTGMIAAKFHHTLAAVVVAVAQRVGERRVVLTGGCFQNVYLTECCIARLRDAGFEPYWHRQIPPNDGGIAYGQVLAAWRELSNSVTQRHKDTQMRREMA